MFRMPRRVMSATVLGAAAALTLVGGTVATAAPTSSSGAAPAATQEHVSRVQLVCTVNDNGVNFRGGPGNDYPVLGQVDKGQKLNYRGRTGDWIFGDLWGGRTGVWIYVAYLDC